MNTNYDYILDNPINKSVLECCEGGTEIYLVGGYIRDLLLKKDCYDKDYAVVGESAIELAHKVADKLESYFIVLDEELDIARVILRDKKNTLDFAKCTKNNINDDLNRRDYTVNSLALKIGDHQAELIDPFNGLEDINKKTIRTVSEFNLKDDPLRILRGFRIASQLDFDIDESTIELLEKHKSLIHEVANERIHIELIKLFQAKKSVRILKLMKETGFLYEIFPGLKAQEKVPPSSYHHLYLIEHSFEVVRRIEKLAESLPEWIGEKLEHEASMGIKYYPLLKIAALLHDYGKPDTWNIEDDGRHRFLKHEEVGAYKAEDLLKDLKFTKNAVKYIFQMIRYHLYPNQLIKTDEHLLKRFEKSEEEFDFTQSVSLKALSRMFRRIDKYTPDLIMIAMADRLSTQGPEITPLRMKYDVKVLEWFLSRYKEFMPKVQDIPELIDGKEIMDILSIQPGRIIGDIKTELKEMQLSGEINNKEEAVEFVKDFYSKLKQVQ